MTYQLTIEQAIARAEDGMERALAHAEQECNRWGELAYRFLEVHCRRHQSFISEDVSEASRKYGLIQPTTDKAWGAVYKRAQAAGIIVMDGTGRSTRRHGTLCPKWRSLIYGVPAS